MLSLFLFNCSSNDTPSIQQEEEQEEEQEETVISPEDRLPLVAISTNGNQIVDEPKIDATFTIIEGDAVSYEGGMGIEIRGASSQMFPKKSFGFETRDAANEDLDVSVLEFPEEEDWILYFFLYTSDAADEYTFCCIYASLLI